MAVGPTPPRGEETQVFLWADWSGPYLGAQGSAGGLFGKGYFDHVAIGFRAALQRHGQGAARHGPLVLGVEADAADALSASQKAARRAAERRRDRGRDKDHDRDR